MARFLATSEQMDRQIKALSGGAFGQEIQNTIKRMQELSHPEIPSAHDYLSSMYSARAIAEAMRADRTLIEAAQSARWFEELQVPTFGQHLSDLFKTQSFDDQVGQLNRTIETLSSIPSFIGEFEFEDEAIDYEDDEHTDADGADMLPEDVRERIARVEYLPVRLVEAIHESPDLMRGLQPREFEEFVAEILQGLGFESVTLTPPSGDGGRDIFATQRVNGISYLVNFECKRYAQNRKVGPRILRNLLGVCETPKTQANLGVLVTTSTFTSGAKELIVADTRLDGKDFDDLVAWVKSYFSHKG